MAGAILAAAPSIAATEKVLHSFQGGGDGAYPFAGLENVDGVLYGTTQYGGGEGCSENAGCGTVFSITPAGVETVVYSFKGGHDGKQPSAQLTNVDGMLYGTTIAGGGSNKGTAFSVTPAGSKTLLFTFRSGDGTEPISRLKSNGRKLYGTTIVGGGIGCAGRGCGVVFSLTEEGEEKILHIFRGGHRDGAYPSAGLVDVGGVLYGTTTEGGAHNEGTVFSVTPTGIETVLYSFGAYYGDAVGPHGDLKNMGGTLYGTTYAGGANDAGTVFGVTTSGAESVLYSFKGGSDGKAPYAGLIEVDGTLYGTTEEGGGTGCGDYGCGTVFSVTPSGVEAVLYSFKGGADGANPYGNLTDVNGTLFGVTQKGGGGRCTLEGTCGTVFSLTR